MNKKIIIFGGSSGLGFEIAKTFGSKKYEIILISSNESKLISASEKLNSLNFKTGYLKCNLCVDEEVDSVCEYLNNNSPSIELIVFSSAKGYFGRFEDLKISLIESSYKINGLSYIKILNKSMNVNKNIRYIYISSYVSKIPFYYMSVYSSSKIIIEKIFEVLKLENGKGKFLTVYPGPMKTEFDNSAIVENNTKVRIASKKLNPELISKKIYYHYINKKEILEINSILINLIFLFKVLFGKLFVQFLRFFK